MTTYIYKGISDYYYYDNCLAKYGDVLEVSPEKVRNATSKVTITNIPSDTIADLLKVCSEQDEPLSRDTLYKCPLDDEHTLKTIIDLNKETLVKLFKLGILSTNKENCRSYNVGNSDYSKHIIQPWTIWQDYNLNPWDADIVKRVLRTKEEEGLSENNSRILDYEKIIHICTERIRQLKN